MNKTYDAGKIIFILQSLVIISGANGQKVSIFPSKTAYTTANRHITLVCNFTGRLTRNRLEWKRNGQTVATLFYENNRCTRQSSELVTGKGSFSYSCRNGLTFTIINIGEKNHGDKWSCSVDNLDSEATTIYVQGIHLIYSLYLSNNL